MHAFLDNIVHFSGWYVFLVLPVFPQQSVCPLNAFPDIHIVQVSIFLDTKKQLVDQEIFPLSRDAALLSLSTLTKILPSRVSQRAS